MFWFKFNFIVLKSSSDEDSDDDEEENGKQDVEMEEEKVETKFNLTNEENENFKNLEEGWTFVTKTGKHLTKNWFFFIK